GIRDYKVTGVQTCALPISYFSGGTASSYTATVSGTSDPTMYQSERFAKTLTYNIPVANGTYDVTLDFSEMFFNGAGKRVFNVSKIGRASCRERVLMTVVAE